MGNTKVVSTSARLSAHQSSQPSHQRFNSSLRTEDSTLGRMVSAFPSALTTLSPGTQSGRSTRSCSVSSPSGNSRKTPMVPSTTESSTSKMVRLTSSTESALLWLQENQLSSTRNSNRSLLTTLTLLESTRSQLDSRSGRNSRRNGLRLRESKKRERESKRRKRDLLSSRPRKRPGFKPSSKPRRRNSSNFRRLQLTTSNKSKKWD